VDEGSFLALIHPDDRAAHQARRDAQRADPRARTYAYEFRIRRADTGEERSLSSRGEFVRDAEGRVVLIRGVQQDITELRRAEAGRAAAAARAALAMRTGGLVAWELEPASGRLQAEPALALLFGAAPGASRETLTARIHPDDTARWREALLPAERAEGVYRCEFRIRRADTGEERWLLGVGEGVRGADGAVRVVGYNADITERRRAAAALALSEARLNALIESMPQIAFTATPDGRHDFTNGRWQDVTGQSAGEARGAGWLDAVHAEDRPGLAALWQAALAEGSTFSAEHRLRSGGGEWVWFLSRAVPLRDPETGVVMRWFGTSTDISDIVAAREAAARSAAELERRVTERTRALSEAAAELRAEIARREEAQAALLQAQKMEALGQLTGGVAHDFNNLLAVVQGALHLLEARVAGDERAAAILAHARHAGERGARLVAQLMSFARRERLHPVALDPAELLRRSEDML